MTSSGVQAEQLGLGLLAFLRAGNFFVDERQVAKQPEGDGQVNVGGTVAKHGETT